MGSGTKFLFLMLYKFTRELEIKWADEQNTSLTGRSISTGTEERTGEQEFRVECWGRMKES